MVLVLKNVHIECRIPGADVNPHFIIAGILAAGIAGITEQLSLGEPVTGNAYNATGVDQIPRSLADALP